MRLLLLLLILLLPSTYINACEQEEAFDVAISTIKQKYPQLYEAYRPYEISVFNEDWLILGRHKKGTFGGGMPEVIVSKDTCRVLHVQLSR